MGAATVLVNVSALAPGNVAVISTVGGAICGYWAMGSCSAATSPANTMMMDSTDAKIGRVMKNLVVEIPVYVCVPEPGWEGAAGDASLGAWGATTAPDES